MWLTMHSMLQSQRTLPALQGFTGKAATQRQDILQHVPSLTGMAMTGTACPSSLPRPDSKAMQHPLPHLSVALDTHPCCGQTST